jgi:hypothetical protein
LVDGRLSALELGERWTRNLVFPGFRPKPSTLKRVDVEQVDHINVVQGQLQTREEAGPLGFEILLAESAAGRQQPVVRPSVVVGESTIGLDKVGGHVWLLSRVPELNATILDPRRPRNVSMGTDRRLPASGAIL